MANKNVLTLFPPNQAFFKLGLSPEDLAATGKTEGDIKDAMYKLEKRIINEMEISNLRPKLVHLLKKLIVGGSAIIYVPEDGSPEVFTLEQFGVKRDKQGKVIKMIIKQGVVYNALPQDVQRQIKDVPEECKSGKKDLEMYTCIVLKEDGKYHVHQEIYKSIIPSTKGKYLPEDLPYLFVPFVDAGEDFGRSYVEDHLGDLQSYEGLRQSILEGAAESARIVYLLAPNAILSPKKLQDAKSGDVVTGLASDVTTLQADKRLDMSVTQVEADRLRQELAVTFLLDSSVRRNAERVTAEEIRQVSQELEVSLGGIYSSLATNLQAPLVKLYMNRLVKKNQLPAILKGALKLEVTTGSAALGRGSDFQTLTTFVSTIAQLGQNPVAQQYLVMDEFIKRIAYSLDINTASLVKTQEQMQQEAAAAQEAQMMQQAGPKLMEEAAKSELKQQE